MGRDSFSQCGGCGKRILWIKTPSGKNMPCDPTLHNYRAVPGGKEKIVLPNGQVVSGETGVKPEEADGSGYISHFATCTRAKTFRRRYQVW